MRKRKNYTYALYYGDNFIDLGNRKYIANLLKVDEKTVDFYTYPSWLKRKKQENTGIIVIKWKG